MNPNTTNTPQTLTLYGNMGHNPEARTIPAKHDIITVFDPVTDGPIEKVIDRPEINFLTYSVACGGYGDIPLRWVNCVDWDGEGHRARQGDKVKLTGSFENRTFTKADGEPKTVRQFVVATCTIVRMKCRELE